MDDILRSPDSAPATDNSPPKTFDLEGMLQSKLGARVTSTNPDGSVQIQLPSGDSKSMDVQGMLKSKGLDPNQLNIKYNSPATAVEGAHIGLGTKIALSLAGNKPEDRMKALSNLYNPNEMSQLPNGQIAIKDNGVWKNTDPKGFLQNAGQIGVDVATSAPETAGYMAGELGGAEAGMATGAALGAGIGSIVPGIGTVIGGLAGGIVGGVAGKMLGGGLGMGLAEVIKDKGLEQVGMKTEFDGKQALDVMKKDLALGMAFSLLPPVARAVVSNPIGNRVVGGLIGAAGGAAAGYAVDGSTGAKVGATAGGLAGATLGTRAMGTMLKGLGSTTKDFWDFTQANATTGAADFFRKVVPGTQGNDWSVVLRSPEDAAAVKNGIDAIGGFLEKRAGAYTPDAVDPVSQRLVTTAKTAIMEAKDSAEQQYGKNIGLLENSIDLENHRVDVQAVATNLQQKLGNLGLLQQTGADGKVLKVVRRDNPLAQEIMQVSDTNSLSTLGQVWDSLQGALTRSKAGQPGQLFFKGDNGAENLLKKVDDILESFGAYSGNKAAISNSTEQTLFGLRGDLREALASSLEKKSVTLEDGTVTNARTFWDTEIKGKYHEFVNAYTPIAKQMGGGNKQAQEAVMRMLGPKGAQLETDFAGMINNAGLDPKDYIPKLQQQRAAINLAEAYNSNAGKGSIFSSMLGLSPKLQVERIAQQKMAQATNQVATKTPVSGITKTAVQSVAHGLSMINSMGTGDKINLMYNPVIMEQFSKTLFGAPAQYQQTAQQLGQQVQQKLQGQGK